MHTLFKKLKALPRIEFTDEDLSGIHLPHEEALMVTLRIAIFDVRRVLIDNGNAINVILLDTLKALRKLGRTVQGSEG